MKEEEPKKKRKQEVAEEDGAKAHKRPWQERYATVGEIKAFLSDHVYLRYNTVKHRVEARVPPGDPLTCRRYSGRASCPASTRSSTT